jgi:hypothetical protein
MPAVFFSGVVKQLVGGVETLVAAAAGTLMALPLRVWPRQSDDL